MRAEAMMVTGFRPQKEFRSDLQIQVLMPPQLIVLPGWKRSGTLRSKLTSAQTSVVSPEEALATREEARAEEARAEEARAEEASERRARVNRILVIADNPSEYAGSKDRGARHEGYLSLFFCHK
jgi:hypothetical protein